MDVPITKIRSIVENVGLAILYSFASGLDLALSHEYENICSKNQDRCDTVLTLIIWGGAAALSAVTGIFL